MLRSVVCRCVEEDLVVDLGSKLKLCILNSLCVNWFEGRCWKVKEKSHRRALMMHRGGTAQRWDCQCSLIHMQSFPILLCNSLTCTARQLAVVCNASTSFFFCQLLHFSRHVLELLFQWSYLHFNVCPSMHDINDWAFHVHIAEYI